ncbi:retrovirus-related pol polyprotein from transposon TNT 1-94 [Tanacetum coccineum]|uniref:Retrovirus-related pol polyprotein from transposon TNT 1-94 n=1 Tax=Tanacetum coccineum TaxID=301880 RepID=A0ABQ4WCL5_9ASTR
MPPTPDLSFTGLDEFVNEHVVENYKAKSSEEDPKVVRKNDDAPTVEDWVSDNKEKDVTQPKTEKKTVRPSFVKKEFVKPKQQNKTTRKTVKQAEHNRQNTHSPRGNQRNWNNMMSQKLGSNFEMFNKAFYVCGSFDHLQVYLLKTYLKMMQDSVLLVKRAKQHRASSRTPQQNGVAERRNKTLIETAKTMLADSKLPTTFWAEAVNTACYVQNRVSVVKPHNKTPYELFHGKFDGKADECFFVRYSMNSKAFRVFNSRTRIVEENLHIRFSKSTPNVVTSGPDWLFDIDILTRIMNYEPVIAGTQSNGFACIKANVNAGQAKKETKLVRDYILLPLWTADPPFSAALKNSHNDDYKPSSDDGEKVDEDPRTDSEYKDQEKDDSNTNNVNAASNVNADDTVSLAVNAASSNEFNVVDGNKDNEFPFDPNMLDLEDIGTFEFSYGNEDDGEQADMNNLETTIQVSPTPTTRIHKGYPLDQVIGDLQSATQTRRMSKNLEEHGLDGTILKQRTSHKDLQNCLFACFLSQEEPKKNERGIVIRNKARLVAQGYTQEEGIDYDEIFSLVARMEAIRLFLAYASFKDYVVYQMDVKSAFLYGKIKEEVYVCQPPGFEDPDFPDRVYKVEKELYGLHQAPRTWYETLPTYLLENGFQRGKIDKTLFIKRHKGDILLVQVYVDGIIFGSISKVLCIAFEKLMHEKFQMSSMGELTFFLGLQVRQKNDGIFISQDKYVAEILKKFGFTQVKTASTPIETHKPLLKDEDGEDVDVYLYRSMIGSLMYLTSSRPDIMFAVCVCARYQVNLNVSHLHVVKRILVDFLNAHQIRYALTVNPTIYSSCIEQFWSTAKAKTINGEVQIHALVDRKKVIITESSVRRDLQLADEEGINSLPNSTIFDNLALMGVSKKPKRKDTEVPQPSGPTTNVADEVVYEEWDASLERAVTTAASLEAEQDNGNILKTQSKATPNEASSLGTTSGGGPRCQETMGDTIAQTRFENVSKTSNDLLLARGNTLRSSEDSMKLQELMELSTNLQQRVLELENTKTTQQTKITSQQKEITSLKRRVKKLEKKDGSRTHKLKRLYRVGSTRRVESSDNDESLGKDASKQERRISAIDADKDITLVNVNKDVDKDTFDVDVLDGEEVVVEHEVANQGVVDEITLAQALLEIKSATPKKKSEVVITAATITTVDVTLAPKAKGIIFKEPSESTTTTTVLSQPKQQSQDKGKGKMVEEPVKPYKKDQIRLDEELALKLQAKEEEIEADAQLAAQLQAQEQQELTDAEKATLFMELLEKRRKFFALKRAEEKRNKPPRQAQ